MKGFLILFVNLLFSASAFSHFGGIAGWVLTALGGPERLVGRLFFSLLVIPINHPGGGGGRLER